MPRGPLPKPDGAKRRRNQPTIPTTRLPASGRTEPPPKVPSFASLGRTGRAWWRWAWRTPQAAGWPDGMEGVVARRASLEDDLITLDSAPSLNVAELLELEPTAATKQLEWLIRRLASLATGRLTLVREMRELDKALGLTPKAMADLRWSIAEDEVGEARGLRPKLEAVATADDEEDPRQLLA